MYDIKRKNEIKVILNTELKIAFYEFEGIRLFNKKASIHDVYSESSKLGKLDGAVYNFFDFQYLILDIDKRYTNNKINEKSKNLELAKIKKYEKNLEKLNNIIEYMKELNIKINEDIKICSISKGRLVYSSRLNELNEYQEAVERLKDLLDKGEFDEILDALKQNIKLKSLYEEDRHDINRERADKILTKSLKKIRTITDIKIKISPSLDLSEQIILDKKCYSKIMKSTLKEELKVLIEEYRDLL